MNIHTFSDAEGAARAAALRMAALAVEAVQARGRFTVALSGGHSPWRMLEALAALDVPWSGVHVFQVDERVAPAGDPDRNATHIAESLLSRAPIPPAQVHLMPVEAPDLAAAAGRYAKTLADVAGTPPVLDLVHLGLGPDGHTASLVPGDPVLNVTEADVALTGAYQSHRRMTLTYPALNRARRVLWLVTGDDKPAMLARLRAGDPSIPAGKIRADAAEVFATRPRPAISDRPPEDTPMDLEFLMVPGGPPPPPTAAYSHAVRAGDLLFVTGQLGVDPLTGALVEGGVIAQTRQVMTNLKAVLAGAGTSLERAVMVRVYLVNFGDYAEMNAEYASHFAPGRLPARTTVGVTGLALGGAVEIDLIVRP